MLNKFERFVRRYGMVGHGDHVVCAVSGGADSVAMLFAFYLLREKWGITLSAAHYNHGLRAEESDRDERFVRQLCDRLDIPLTVEKGVSKPVKKAWKPLPETQDTDFLPRWRAKLPPPTQPMIMRKRC